MVFLFFFFFSFAISVVHMSAMKNFYICFISDKNDIFFLVTKIKAISRKRQE